MELRQRNKRRRYSLLLARAIGLLVLVFFILSCVLRWQACRFDRRATEIVRAIGHLKVQETSAQEAVEAAMKLGFRPERPQLCDQNDCTYSLEMSRVPPNEKVTKAAMFLSNWRITRALSYWVGLRFWLLGAEITVGKGRLREIGYRVIINEGLAPESLIVGVNSVGQIPAGRTATGTSAFQVKRFPRYGDNVMRITFTPDASDATIQAAFHLNLGCLWKLKRCRSADDFLPEIPGLR